MSRVREQCGCKFAPYSSPPAIDVRCPGLVTVLVVYVIALCSVLFCSVRLSYICHIFSVPSGLQRCVARYNIRHAHLFLSRLNWKEQMANSERMKPLIFNYPSASLLGI